MHKKKMNRKKYKLNLHRQTKKTQSKNKKKFEKSQLFT